MTAADIAVASGAEVQFGASGATYGGVISGAGALRISSGSLRLNGANSYTGMTSVSGGTLTLGASGSLSSATTLTMSGGTFGLNGKTQTVAGLGGTGTSAVVALGAGRLTVNGGGTYLGTITGTGSLTKQGTGTQTLTGANTDSGGTSINAGTLVAGNNTALGSGTATVTAGGTLEVGSGVTLANAIALNGGAITGTGTLSADLVIADGGTLKPGNSPGTLHGTTATWGAGGIYAFEVSDFGLPAGTGWDLLSLTGTLALTATALDPFLIRLTSLDADNTPGLAAHFHPTNPLNLKLVEFTAVTGFSASLFSVDSSGFQNLGAPSKAEALDSRAVGPGCWGSRTRAGRGPRRDGAFAPSRRFIPSPAVGMSPQVRRNRFGRGECPVRRFE